MPSYQVEAEPPKGTAGRAGIRIRLRSGKSVTRHFAHGSPLSALLGFIQHEMGAAAEGGSGEPSLQPFELWSSHPRQRVDLSNPLARLGDLKVLNTAVSVEESA